MIITINDLTEKVTPLLDHVQREIQQTFNGRVISLFKLGSLGAHGDFSLCSDVDVAIMLDNIQESDQETIDTLSDQLKKSEFEYADRLSIFWSSYHAKDFANALGRFPSLDRLDLIHHATLIAGTDRRGELHEPKPNELIIESAHFISTFMLAGEKFDELTQSPHMILAKGARYFTKFVLFPVRLILTLDYPGVVGSNKDAIDHFNQSWKDSLPATVSELINFAHKLRNTDPNQPVTFSQSRLKESLLALYSYCLERYSQTTTELNHHDVAETLKSALAVVAPSRRPPACPVGP